MPSRRMSRVADLLRDELSDLIRREVRDPRLAEITSITHVTVSADLRNARVYVSILGSGDEKQQTLKGLQSAASFIRRGLRGRITLRYTPFLAFYLDESIETGAHLVALMEEEAQSTPSDASKTQA